MGSILNSDFYKLFKMKSFYICLIISAVLGFFEILMIQLSNNMMLEVQNEAGVVVNDLTVTMKDCLQSVFNNGDFSIIVIIAIVLFVTVEYSSGTLKNLVGRGCSRSKLFLSKTVTSVVEALLLYAAFAVCYIVSGFAMLSTDGIDNEFVSRLLLTYAVQILIVIAGVCVMVAVSTLLRSKGGAIAVLICANILVPMIIQIIYMVSFSGDNVNEMVDAVSGKSGALSQYWIFMTASNVWGNIANGEVYISLIIPVVYIIASVAVGLAVFKKRDIK